MSDLRVDVMDDEIIVGLPGRTIYQAKAELYFTFGALAVEVHGVITVIFTVSA